MKMACRICIHYFYAMPLTEQFYVPGLRPGASQGSLPPAEARHALKVLRLQTGQPIAITNGVGCRFQALTIPSAKGEMDFHITSHMQDGALPEGSFELAIALPKSEDRLEWLLEKAVELGTTKITLLHTERTEKASIRVERLQRIMAAALKQSLRSIMPKLTGPIAFSTFLLHCHADVRLVSHCVPGIPYVQALSQAFSGERHYVALVGPEGDFTSDEVALAQNGGFVATHLGPIRLRTETAGMAFAAAYHSAIWQTRPPQFGM